MKVFDLSHAIGHYVSHAISSLKISLIMICSGAIGLVHALVPFFLTDFMSLANERIKKMIDSNEV